MNKEQEEEVRKLLIKSHFYKIMAAFLAVLGVLALGEIYERNIGNDVMEFIRRPILIFMVLIPLLPAYVLFMLNRKSRKKAAKIIDENPKVEEKKEPEDGLEMLQAKNRHFIK